MAIPKSDFSSPLSAQKVIYNFLIVNLIMLSFMIMRPHVLAPFIRQDHIFFPVCVIMVAALVVFFRETMATYFELQQSLPKDRS